VATAVGTYVIERFDLGALSEKDVRQIADLYNTLGQERVPEDPVPDPQIVIDRLRSRPNMMEFVEWLARLGTGDIVATGSLIAFTGDTNQRFREVGLSVLPDHRRQGIARRFLEEMVRSFDRDDLVLSFFTNARVPAGEAFVRRLGAGETLRARFSQLVLADLDRGLTREWARLDPAGYHLAWIDGDVPDRYVANVITAYEAMNTAPRGTSALEDWHVTVEHVREFDRSRSAARRLRRLLLAIDDRTGETAGYTEVVYDPRTPHVVNQQGTAVIPSHRRRGLGKWVKAAMLERIVDEWPAARLVRTGNASVNEPMLRINDRLGFRYAWESVQWEAGVPAVRRYLEAGGR